MKEILLDFFTFGQFGYFSKHYFFSDDMRVNKAAWNDNNKLRYVLIKRNDTSVQLQTKNCYLGCRPSSVFIFFNLHFMVTLNKLIFFNFLYYDKRYRLEMFV